MTLGGVVAQKKFYYKDNYAWELDMLNRGEYSEIEWDNIDNVDFMIFAGHGFYDGYHDVTRNSLHYYTLNSLTKFHDHGEAGAPYPICRTQPS